MKYLIYRNDGIGDLIVTSKIFLAIHELNTNYEIFLVCSNRNVKYAKELKKSGLISDFINFDNYTNNIVDLIRQIKKIRSLDIDISLIYKINNKNLLINLLSKSKRQYSILPLKQGKFFKKKYKIPYLISKILFNDVEVIDERNNYENQKNIHMGQHFFNLFKKTLNENLNEKKYTYPKLTSINDEKNKIRNYLKLIANGKKIIVLHIDEKWSVNKLNDINVFQMFKSIHYQSKKNYVIMITTGMHLTDINSFFRKNLNIENYDAVDIDMKYSLSYSDVYVLERINLIDLISLISQSHLVIEPHGSITHIASIYNIPLIDVIKNESRSFFLKWKPKSNIYKQVEFKDIEKIGNLLKEFM